MFGRGRQSRPFGKGDLKYVFLDLLAEKPRHGYDLIRALEERFGGTYTASPGTVYPVLQLLEDMGHVSVEERDGRKIYTVTATGQAFLAAHRDQVADIWERATHGHGMHDPRVLMAMMHELRELGMLFRGRGGHAMDPRQIARIRDVIVKARREIEEILSEV